MTLTTALQGRQYDQRPSSDGAGELLCVDYGDHSFFGRKGPFAIGLGAALALGAASVARSQSPMSRAQILPMSSPSMRVTSRAAIWTSQTPTQRSMSTGRPFTRLG